MPCNLFFLGTAEPKIGFGVDKPVRNESGKEGRIKGVKEEKTNMNEMKVIFLGTAFPYGCVGWEPVASSESWKTIEIESPEGRLRLAEGCEEKACH